jgi:hypothetical protein
MMISCEKCSYDSIKNTNIMAQVDYLIDIGPKAGEKGGSIVAQGKPEQVAKSKESRTAPFIKKRWQSYNKWRRFPTSKPRANKFFYHEYARMITNRWMMKPSMMDFRTTEYTEFTEPAQWVWNKPDKFPFTCLCSLVGSKNTPRGSISPKPWVFSPWSNHPQMPVLKARRKSFPNYILTKNCVKTEFKSCFTQNFTGEMLFSS